MRLAALLLVLAAACGHDRAALVAAHVTGGSGDAQQAVEGASGTLDCPDEPFPRQLGRSDEDGELRAQHVGTVPLACTVTISKSGYRQFKALLRDVCGAPAGRGCQTAELRVTLVPEPGKNQEPPK